MGDINWLKRWIHDSELDTGRTTFFKILHFLLLFSFLLGMSSGIFLQIFSFSSTPGKNHWDRGCQHGELRFLTDSATSWHPAHDHGAVSRLIHYLYSRETPASPRSSNEIETCYGYWKPLWQSSTFLIVRRCIPFFGELPLTPSLLSANYRHQYSTMCYLHGGLRFKLG